MRSPGPALGRVRPSVVSRGLARFADWVLLALVFSLLGLAIYGLTGRSLNPVDQATGQLGADIRQVSLWVVLFVAITAAYEITMIATRGATVGKQVLGVRVVTYSDTGLASYAPPGWRVSAKRWLIPGALSLVNLVPIAVAIYLTALLDDSRRGWHDKFAGTVVVKD